MGEILILDIGTLTFNNGHINSMGDYERDIDVSSIAGKEIEALRRAVGYDEGRDKILNTIKYWKNMLPISLGLLQIAAALSKRGYAISYINLEYLYRKNSFSDFSSIEKYFSNISLPSLVMLTSMTPSFSFLEKICKIIKDINQSIQVIVGGVHASSLFQEIIMNPNIDIVAIGEGDLTAVEIADHFLSKRPKIKLEEILGITYKSKKSIIVNPHRKLISDLTYVSPPDFGLLPDLQNEKEIRPLNSLVMAGRGCAFRCAYCVESRFWQRKVRFFPPEQVIRNIKYLQEKFHMDYFHLPDSSLDIDEDYLTKLTSLLRKEVKNAYFMCNVSPHLINRRMIKLLKDANFAGVYMGMENCDDDVLKMMRRPTFEVTENAIKMCAREKMSFIGGALMVGLPKETEETFKSGMEKFKRLVDFCLSNGTILHINPTTLTPYPGSELFHYPDKFGLTILTKEYNLYNRSHVVHRTRLLSQQKIREMYITLREEISNWYNG